MYPLKRYPSKRRSIARTSTHDHADPKDPFSTFSTLPPALEDAIHRDFIHDKRSRMNRLNRSSLDLRTDGYLR